MSDVTQLLQAIEAGDRRAAEDLLPLVYEELRHLAAAQMAQEKSGQTLDATGLVHEARLRLVKDASPQAAWERHRHFFAAAAEAMRRILIKNARRKVSLKRGGGRARLPLPDVPASDPDEMLIALDDALLELAANDSLAARIVELHHFAGLTQEETAATLGLTVNQIRQKWTVARAWLKMVLTCTPSFLS